LLNGTTQTSAGVVILNTLPTTPNISLSPANPNTTSDLVCTASGGTDLDLDSVTYFYEWYNGTTLMFTTGNQSGPSTLDNGNTTKDDVWNCTAIPFDGEGNGTANSTTVTILNSAPIIGSLSIAAPIIKGGMQQQVDAVGQGDDDSDTLDFYCCDTSDTCTPDTLADTKASPYGGMNWTYNAPLLGFANVTVRCLVSDGTANSSIVSANYTEDDSIPSIFFYEPPTPLDGGRNVGNSVTIKANVTNNLTIDTCIIEFDGANYTMTQEGAGNSVNCSYTNGSLVDGFTYTYIVYANDSVDNLAVSGLRNFTENSLPVSSTPFVTPDPANTTDDLVCNATLTDVEDPSLDANWTWYKNGEINETGQTTLVPSGSNVSITLSSVNTTRGENWSCSVLPYDGYEYGLQENSSNVTILNSPPSVAWANITPDIAYDITDLTCENGSVSDADDDPVTLNYDWYNGTDWLGINSKVLGNGNTTPGDYWNCSITPFDGTDNGTNVTSEERLISAIECNITMGTYWNSISLCANSTNKSIKSVLAGLDYSYVMRWNTTSQQFDIWSKDAIANPFDEFDTNNSYFVYLNSGPAVLNVTGTQNPDMNISLAQYWNEPAYPYEFNTTVEKAMSSINDTFQYLMKWNNTAQQFDIYSTQLFAEPFTNISVGDGLFVYTNASTTLAYNRSQL
jgi:hypothetical protein